MTPRNFIFFVLTPILLLWSGIFSYVTTQQQIQTAHVPPTTEGARAEVPKAETENLEPFIEPPLVTGKVENEVTTAIEIPLLNEVSTTPTSLPSEKILPPPQEPPMPTEQVSVTPSKIGALNQQDIFLLTNKERVNAGLPELHFSARLSAIAEAKAVDMIDKQYFEHVSPSGVGIAQLSEIYGYKYISIGENLALGTFSDSADVLLGWMNSPGHRANILKPAYTEIGISAILGNYEGNEVWFAVQEFGRPLSDCTPPDTYLEKKIIIFNDQLKSLSTTLANLKSKMEVGTIEERNKHINDYNTIVGLYNDILSTVKSDVEQYNESVRAYNQCIDLGE